MGRKIESSANLNKKIELSLSFIMLSSKFTQPWPNGEMKRPLVELNRADRHEDDKHPAAQQW